MGGEKLSSPLTTPAQNIFGVKIPNVYLSSQGRIFPVECDSWQTASVSPHTRYARVQCTSPSAGLPPLPRATIVDSTVGNGVRLLWQPTDMRRSSITECFLNWWIL